MNPTRGMRNRWLLALGGAALVVVTSSCSTLIAQSGGSRAGDIYTLETRAEVREAFGEADETGACPDGRTVERRTIYQQTRSALGDAKDWLPPDPRAFPLWGLAEVVATPVQLYRREQAKFQYAWVYGADDRVLYRYNVTPVPATRFGEAISPLADSLSLQLKEGGCPSWEGCLNAFAAEARQRAACVGYPLTPEDEGTLHRVQALATEVDAGRIAQDETLAKVKWCLWCLGNPPWSCLRP